MSSSIVILTAVAVFLIVILLLVSLLLYARKRLVPQGKVHVEINGEKDLEVEMGNSLLSTLAAQKIFLPSACGGKGSCGLCRVQVPEGGGSILPSEQGFFTRKEQGDHWRLACQVKVRNDMKVQVPAAVFGIRKWECEVVSSRNVATFIREFVVKLPEGEKLNFRSGGYIQIDVPACTVDYKDIEVAEPYKSEWERMKMFDLTMKNTEPCFRAYSMANHPAEGDRIMLNVRIATPPFDRKTGQWMKFNPGVCSSYVYSLKPGDKITISGPYGEFFVQDTQREMMFIGGGAGMAPMRSQIFDQFKTRHTQRKASFWYGGRSLKELFYMDEYEQLAKENPNFSFHVALSEPLPEDHWTGDTGFIHQVIFNKYLKNHPEPEEIEYYLCGPKPMTDAVVRMLDGLGVPPEMIRYDNFGN